MHDYGCETTAPRWLGNQQHDHKPCNVWHVATTQSPSISHHLTSTLTTTLDTAKTLEPPLDTYQDPTTTPSHHLAAMVSINNPLQHQLQALKTIKGLLDTLCTLIECLVNMLTMDLNYPNHLLPAPLCKLCMPHRLWLPVPTPTKKTLPWLHLTLTRTKPTVAYGCQALFKTKDYICLP